ncbi:MAG: hypothetical protein H6705_16880 [Myxococcales bacterium]|nr:hypothetical protein [Myxococcales bacterium]
MAFYPIIGGGGGAGGGFGPVTITGTTEEIAASASADLDIPLPSGTTRYTIVGARLSRTAGTSALCGVAVYQTDARSDAASYVFGNAFGGVDMPGPVKGPLDTTGGNSSRAPISLQSDDEFVRLTLTNNDFDDAGTFALELDILPLGGV